MIKIIPFILFVLLAVYFVQDIQTPYEGYDSIYQWLGGWGLLIGVGILSIIITKIKAGDKSTGLSKSVEL